MFRQTEGEHLTFSFQQACVAASRILVQTVSWYKAGIALLTAFQCTAAETASPNSAHIRVVGKEEIQAVYKISVSGTNLLCFFNNSQICFFLLKQKS